MTELQQTIERLRGLMERATPGPWFSNRYRGSIDSQVWAGKPGPDTATLICSEGDAGDADADLIATMHNALPLILSALSKPDPGGRERAALQMISTGLPNIRPDRKAKEMRLIATSAWWQPERAGPKV